MRNLFYVAMALLLVTVGCDMPGVGKVREEMNDNIDVLSDEIEDLDMSGDELLARVEVLESGMEAFTGMYTGTGGEYEMPDIEMPDLTGITEEIATLRDSLDTSILALNTTITEMQTALDSMSLENDSLLMKIEDLEDEIDWLDSRITTAYSGSSSGGTTRGGTGTSGGSSGGRTGGTTGTSSGGTTGGSTGGSSGGTSTR